MKPKCPKGLHNKIFRKEECHTHKWKWRQILHEKHCLMLKCPYTKKNYGKYGGKFDTRDKGLI